MQIQTGGDRMKRKKETMSECPKSPNCVSSLSPAPKRYIAPFRFDGSAETALEKILSIIKDNGRAQVVSTQGNYIKAEFRSLLFRFVDDVEFLIDDKERIIHVKSASRKGFYDFGVNRRRIEKLRRQFEQATQ
jgi:uncharacterized protein (DUF1499 family)